MTRLKLMPVTVNSRNKYRLKKLETFRVGEWTDAQGFDFDCFAICQDYYDRGNAWLRLESKSGKRTHFVFNSDRSIRRECR